jgi:DHA2 family multidrug resistance protein
VPLSQSILFNTFPRRQHTMVMSVFGMAVAVAPAFGPVIGGYLAEIYSWRWSFYMLVPIGVCATIGMRWTLPPDNSSPSALRLDRLHRARHGACGRAARAGARRAAGLVRFDGDRHRMPDRGPRILHFHGAQPERREPFLNLKLLADRNYAIGLALVTIYGMLNFTPMVLLPPLLQQQAGFPDALVGQVIGCRGVGMLVGFMTAGFMSRIDPRISMAFGFGLQTVAGLWMLTFDLNVTMEVLVINSVVQGFCRRIVWVPITTVAFGTLDAKHYAEASAVFHLLRNIGSSFFISLSIAEIVRASGANYSRMNRDDHALQPRTDDAGHDRGLEFRHGAGTCARGEGNPAPGDDDRLSERVCDVHRDVGACRCVRADGPAPQGVTCFRFPVNGARKF